jgi:hypothetical protein
VSFLQDLQMAKRWVSVWHALEPPFHHDRMASPTEREATDSQWDRQWENPDCAMAVPWERMEPKKERERVPEREHQQLAKLAKYQPDC